MTNLDIPYYLNSAKRVLNGNRCLNIFNPSIISATNRKGAALLVYIVYPFYMDTASSRFRSHINNGNAKMIVQVLNDLGYAVDVIDYRDIATFDTKQKYDVVIGIDKVFDYDKPCMKTATKIFYSTGLHFVEATRLTYERHIRFMQRHGVFISPQRIPLPLYSPEKSDCIISIQNQFTDCSYRMAGKPIYNCTISGTNTFYNMNRKTKNTKTVLWLSGSGMILKGLDLVLDAIADMPDCKLVVCADMSSEEDRQFEEFYYGQIHNSENVQYVGFVDVGSQKFSRIAKDCTAIIFPYPEGEMSGSLVNGMYHGLIPIIGYFSDDKISECSVFTIGTVDGVKDAIRSVMNMSDDEIRIKSKKTLEYAKVHYTAGKEYSDWKRAIKEACDL